MTPIAVAVFTDKESPADWGRFGNALVLAKECHDHDEPVQFIFDGAAVKWLPDLLDKGHKYHRPFMQLWDTVVVCRYCARAYGVHEAVVASELPMPDEYKQHPSLRQRIREGYQVVTF
jgi:hypothetical protein